MLYVKHVLPPACNTPLLPPACNTPLLPHACNTPLLPSACRSSIASHLTMVLSSVDLASLWNVIMTDVEGRERPSQC